MKKVNIILGILTTTLILLLTLKPVNAQAAGLMEQVSNDAVIMAISSILTPIWFMVGRKAKQLLR